MPTVVTHTYAPNVKGFRNRHPGVTLDPSCITRSRKTVMTAEAYMLASSTSPRRGMDP